MLATKRMRFSIDVILVFIRWYAAYPLNRAYLVVTQNTPSPTDLAQMAHTWRDAIYPSKSMAKHLRKMRRATSLCEPVMHHVHTH